MYANKMKKEEEDDEAEKEISMKRQKLAVNTSHLK